MPLQGWRGGMDEGERAARSGGGDGSGQRQHAFGFARVQVFHQRTVDHRDALAAGLGIAPGLQPLARDGDLPGLGA